MTTLLTGINEERLFKLLPNFFERPQGVMIELAQNSRRAGASRMEITLEGDRLSVTDNGHGLSDPTSLFILADSSWSDAVEAEQMPAGWGLFFLYSLSHWVSFKSHFGTIEFQPDRFLGEVRHRPPRHDRSARPRQDPTVPHSWPPPSQDLEPSDRRAAGR